MKRVNIKDRLSHQRDKLMSGQELLQDFKTILDSDDAQEEAIYQSIRESVTQKDQVFNAFKFDLLETDRIFHTDQIKRICTVYRLRFLDSSYFKDELPYEAIRKTKHLQK